MTKETLLSVACMLFFLTLRAQNTTAPKDWIEDFKIGIRTQKAQHFYWENGFTTDFMSPKIGNNRIHFGFSYVTSRLGTAFNTNAIKQDNFIFHAGYYFRPLKKLQPFARFNTGYFHADYESPVFDVLPNTAFLLAVDLGLSYKFKAPYTINISAGYNFNSGNGIEGPGTLYPIFYQMSFLYHLKKK